MSYVANRTLFLRVGGAGLCRPTKSWDQVLESNFFEHPVRAGVRRRCPVLGEGVSRMATAPALVWGVLTVSSLRKLRLREAEEYPKPHSSWVTSLHPNPGLWPHDLPSCLGFAPDTQHEQGPVLWPHGRARISCHPWPPGGRVVQVLAGLLWPPDPESAGWSDEARSARLG